MKKLIGLVIALVIVLAAISTGTAYYIGKRFETELNKGIQQANQQLTTNTERQSVSLPKNLRISLENYQRSIFTSQFQIKFVDTTAADKPPLLVFNASLHHGPFSFTELARLNFLPAAVLQISPVMDQGSINVQISKFTQGKEYFTSTRHIYYGLSHKTITEAQIAPFHYQDDHLTMDFAGANIHSASNEDAIYAFVPKWFRIIDGEFTLQTGKFAMRFDNKQHLVEIGSISSYFQIKSAKDLASQLVKFNFKDVKLNEYALGEGEISLQINNIDKKLLTEYGPLFDLALNNPESINDSGFHEQMQKALLAMTKAQPELIIDPISWRNDTGIMTYKLKLALNDASQLSPAQLANPLLTFKSLVKFIDSQAVLPKPVLIKLLAQINSFTENKPYDQTVQQATQAIASFSALGGQFNVIKTDKDSISSKISYQDGIVTINGETMPLEQYIATFFAH